MRHKVGMQGHWALSSGVREVQAGTSKGDGRELLHQAWLLRWFLQLLGKGEAAGQRAREHPPVLFRLS
jgi:hypothetical protein